MDTALRSEIATRHLQSYSELSLSAPIKPGLVPSLDARSYTSRVKLVLDTLHLLRTTSREYARMRPYSDATDRIRTINSLRLWVDEDAQRLVLSVGFDRPWEAYLRVVWREVGPLLDVIFCNCSGYPISTECGFEAYGRWIAEARCDTRFFYNAGDLSFDDQDLLIRLERLARTEPPSADLDLTLATLAARPPEAQAQGVVTQTQAVKLPRPRPPGAAAALGTAAASGTAAAAAAAAPDMFTTTAGALEATTQGMQALTVLYRLADAYPPDTPDGRVLQRAALRLLSELSLQQLQDFLRDSEGLPGSPRERFRDALAWYEQALDMPAALPPAPLAPQPDSLQPGVLAPYPVEHSHGCVLLISVIEPRGAAAFLQRVRAWVEASHRPAGPRGAATPTTVVAFGKAGLERLGLGQAEIDRFPIEFREGMAARAGLLGDLRGNHPDNWRLPPVNWPAARRKGVCDGEAPRLQPTAAHIVVQLYTVAAAAEGDHELVGNPAHPLHAAVQALMQGMSGVALWSVQTLRRQFVEPSVPAAPAVKAAASTGADTAPTSGVARGHFGFIDGLSQPDVRGAPHPHAPWDNQVALGDVLLGHANAQGDPAPAATGLPLDMLLHDGSFLVLRKLRQDVQALDDCLARAGTAGLDPAVVKAKMMGRRVDDAAPLVPGGQPMSNDFDYRLDPHGESCPMHSHVRRTNPRTDPHHSVPRIVRRGMSYGPAFRPGDKAERGLMFMAYNARIGEQFETVQRWIAGGNSGGAYSGEADPLLGVPQEGQPRVFRYVDTDAKGAPKVHRVWLDDPAAPEPRPFVRLEWGCYLFVPSLAGLGWLAQRAANPPAPDVAALGLDGERIVQDLLALEGRASRQAALDAWKALFEDPLARRTRRAQAAWTAIRQRHGGVLRTVFGVLVARRDLVLQVLRNPARHYSVAGYNERMRSSFGEIHLGLDDGAAHDALSAAANQAVSALTLVDCFNRARGHTLQQLDRMVENQRSLSASVRAEVPGVGPVPALRHWELSFDAKELVDAVLAELSRDWFDLPDGRFVESGRWNWQLQPPRCPGHFTAPSRYIFQPQPGPEAVRHGQAQGVSVAQAVRQFVADVRSGNRDATGPISSALLAAAALPPYADDDAIARTLVGVMIGFLPTVDGNLRSVLNEWLEQGTFWSLQGALLSNSHADPYLQARDVLLEPLQRALMLRPVPELIWRRATMRHELGGVGVEPGETVVLSLVSATQQGLDEGVVDVTPAFGGDRQAADAPLHACPGQQAALGVMLGMLMALMEAGTIHSTAAPLTLRLRGAIPPRAAPVGASPPDAPAPPAAPVSAAASRPAASASGA